MEPMNISSTWEHDGENVECFIAIKKTANENWYGTIKPFPETCTMNERTERERIETAKQCSHRNTLATTQAHTHTHFWRERTEILDFDSPRVSRCLNLIRRSELIVATMEILCMRLKRKQQNTLTIHTQFPPPPLPLSPSRARILRKVMKSELVLWCSHITCVSRLMRFHLILKSNNNNNSSSSNQTHAHFALTFRSWHLCVFRVISADGRRFYLPFSFTHSFYRTFHSSHF